MFTVSSLSQNNHYPKFVYLLEEFQHAFFNSLGTCTCMCMYTYLYERVTSLYVHYMCTIHPHCTCISISNMQELSSSFHWCTFMITPVVDDIHIHVYVHAYPHIATCNITVNIQWTLVDLHVSTNVQWSITLIVLWMKNIYTYIVVLYAEVAL